MFLTQMRVMGFALEGTAYAQPQADLTVSNYNFKAYNIKYGPAIEEAKRVYATGDMSAFSSIMGKRSCTVSFSMDMAWGGAVATAPEWGIMLQACGFKQTAHSTTGISWVPHAGYTAVPAVIEVAELSEGANPSQLTIQIRGAMGNAKFVLDSVGKPFRIDFEFTGVLQGMEDRATEIIPASYQTVLPEAVLGATITAFSDTLDLDKINLDVANKVELQVDPSTPEGYSGAHITGREPKVTLDPYLALLATRSNWARLIGGTTGVLSVAIGARIVLSAPALQIVKGFDGGDRSGVVVNTLECILCRSSGNDELEILQGSKT